MATALEFLPIATPVLERIRATGRDAFGNAATPQVREAGLPLRCCLRLSRDGERVRLVAHRPSELGGPYAEVGPVFVHAEACEGYRTPHTFPAEFRDRRAVLRAYGADGMMLDGVLAEPGQSEHLVGRLLADPRVDQVHVRNVVAGCWNFTVRRAST
ncbi:DUF1203 domain-containing protein [Oryzihumus leptocrescens]|nr:DUF1203 domain-containing protein [Oryzihumus leptocrescens]